MEEKNKESKGMPRREFLGALGASAAVFSIVPSHVLGGTQGTAPSDMINVAGIGVGGMGRWNIASLNTPQGLIDMAKQQAAADSTGGSQKRRRPPWGEPKRLANIYALCDVDSEYAKMTIDWYPKAKYYKDYREMLEKEKEIDAVVIATPDHTHAMIAKAAMEAGKHVFCQKPLTRTIHEARVLQETAKKLNLVTQMGNQGHASEGARLIKEWIQDGAIGNVSEVHVWTNRPVWPQGDIPRPPKQDIPASLDWDLWLGPAPAKDYNEAVCHFKWRGWRDYGTGALGDMGAHLIDHPYWALDLGAPSTVTASSSAYNDETYPLASMVTYQFPAIEGRGPVKMTWYDGGLTPARPEVLEAGRQMGNGGSGVLYYGDKGMLMHGDYGRGPRLIPETAMQAYQRPEKTIPRSPGIMEEWLDAIKNGGKSTTDFSYSGPLTETMLLGNVAILMKDKNTILEWDAENMKITNLEEANALLQYDYRQGWKL